MRFISARLRSWIENTKVDKSTTSRAVTGLLLLATAACVMVALLNLADRNGFRLPDDGITWADGPDGVESLHVRRAGAGDQAGIRIGDRLVGIGSFTIDEALDVPRTLAEIGVWRSATYHIERAGTPIEARVIVGVAPSGGVVSSFQWIVGLAYLAIGLTVLLARGPRPMIHHFYLFALTSFVLFCFSYTSRFDALDRFVYWADVWATLLAPALFVHFCLTFPGTDRLSPARRTLSALVYLPAVLLGVVYHLVAAGTIEFSLPLVETRFLLDRISFGLLGVYFITGAVILRRETSLTEDAVLKQQRKWLSVGALWGIIPFAAFYLAPYVAGEIPSARQTLSVFSLALIPLTIAYSIVRYRLMDVELFTRRATAASLAAAGLLAAGYGLLFTLGGLQHTSEGLAPVVWVVSALAGALAYQPLRRWVQAGLDRYHYRERYDSRRTLADFAAALTTETDLGKTLDSVINRLSNTLRLDRVAVFVREEQGQGITRFRIAGSSGLDISDDRLDLEFLTVHASGLDGSLPHLHLEDPGRVAGPLAAYGATFSALDLYDYVPCRMQGRTIAYLGLGRMRDGQYLNSEDIKLVHALSGYLAIALENARLYDSLDRKARQYERLKDYSENIVESLSVGICAAGLDDRVESWNTPLELMFGISRRQAADRKLSELVPPKLVAEIDKIQSESGLQNFYRFTLKAADFPAEFRPAAGVKRDDEERVLNIVVAPLVTKTFEHIGRLIIFDDVTERSALEDQLIQADKLSSVGLLAAGVAHEVNTPLAVISSYAQMLARQVSEEPKTAQILNKITAQTFRASEIVNSLLNFSRTSGHEKMPLDLPRVITETLDMVSPQLRKAHIAVETDFSAAARVLGNSGQLQQVLLNLVLNARDAMPEGGRLTIQTREHDGTAIITVRDTGVGMTPEQSRRIFDPFFTTKGPKRGTGLGLAVSYGIIKEHSGTITVESQPGAGSTFSVEIPLAAKPVHA
ncbi:MAG: ATP-binding protein [Acidobacteria bacterium]|nr:ATP-binding protein [Acidobacteriota bacterium]